MKLTEIVRSRSPLNSLRVKEMPANGGAKRGKEEKRKIGDDEKWPSIASKK